MVDGQACGKPVNITTCISTAPGACNRRKADKHGRLLPFFSEERSSCYIAIVAVACERAVRTRASGMDSSLGDLLRHSQQSGTHMRICALDLLVHGRSG